MNDKSENKVMAYLGSDLVERLESFIQAQNEYQDSMQFTKSYVLRLALEEYLDGKEQNVTET